MKLKVKQNYSCNNVEEFVLIGASGLSSSLKNSGEKIVVEEADLDNDGGGGEALLRLNFLCAALLIKLV